MEGVPNRDAVGCGGSVGFNQCSKPCVLFLKIFIVAGQRDGMFFLIERFPYEFA
jgi:hypothetical protein